jgi:photosystem II stability/assembly factor-like uncharacterized protein
MRAAAVAVAICATALAAGCDSGHELSLSNPRVLKGDVEGPNVAGVTARQPVRVDFVSARVGFVGRQDGTILATRDSGNAWVRRGSVQRLAAFDFVSPRRGFALTQRAVLLATRDGGRSWFRLRRFPLDRAGYAGLVFVDERNGWVVRPSGTAYRTRDAGRTWAHVKLPCDEYDGIVGPSFSDDRVGYLVCTGQPAAGSQGKSLFVTTDGGTSWKLRTRTDFGKTPNGRETIPGWGYAEEISFDRSGIGFMSAGRGGLFRSDTGGLTWKQLFYSEVLGQFAAPSPRRVFAIFRTSVLRSDDGGHRWRSVLPAGFAVPTGAPLFFTERRAIAFGVEEPLGTQHTVLSTRDGGGTWSLRGQIPLRGLVEQAFRFGPTVIATDSRRLVRSDDQGRTWTVISGLPLGAQGWFSFVSPEVGFLADRRRRLWRTEDGGAHWAVVAEKTRELQGVVFTSAREGLVVDWGPPPPDDGRKHADPPEQLLHTDDGGKTWSALDVPFDNITAVAAVDSGHWWIFANTRCELSHPCRSTEILRTADGGGHWDLIRLTRTLDAVATTFISPSTGIVGSVWSGYRVTHDGGVTWRVAYPR